MTVRFFVHAVFWLLTAPAYAGAPPSYPADAKSGYAADMEQKAIIVPDAPAYPNMQAQHPVLVEEEPDTVPSFDPRLFYAGGILLVLGAAGFLLQRRRKSRPGSSSMLEAIAGLESIDNPVTSPAQDKLGFVPLAETLADIFVHKSVEAPLSVMLCGGWGSGKSSLMHLMKNSLRRRGKPVVWFNAWHHQKEQHMLASLLEEIRRQMGPFSFRTRHASRSGRALSLIYATLPEVGGFYLRLFYSRLFDLRYWKLLSMLVLALAAAAAVALSPKWIESLKWSMPEATGMAGGGIAFLWAASSMLSKFGVSPEKLAQAFSGFATTPSCGDALGFRHKFLREFEHLCNAVGGKVVIVIDDLDRCMGTHISDALEAMHFLASSRKCHIISGADYAWIVDNLALQYKDVAEQRGVPPKELAEQYLEKLFNLHVEVPAFTEEAAIALLASNVPSADVAVAWEGKGTKGGPFRHKGVWIVAAGIAVAAAWGIFRLLSPDGAAGLPGDGTGGAAPTPPSAWIQYGYAALAAWAALSVFYLLFRKGGMFGEEVRDSDAFTGALEVWAPFILAAHRNTPRNVKRFVNRLRLYAMLRRGLGMGTDEGALVAYQALRRYQESGHADLSPDRLLSGAETSPLLEEVRRRHAFFRPDAKEERPDAYFGDKEAMKDMDDFCRRFVVR
jgi:hypothetical protein